MGTLSRVAGLMALGTVAALTGIQFVSAQRTNPPSRDPLVAPPQIERILRRACYDCHSNETRWPWYSHIAPISWLVVHDVTVARQEVNFSEWGSYYSATRRHKLQWIGRILHEGKMPPWEYRLLHPVARLNPSDKSALEEWIASTLAVSSPEQSQP